MKKLTLILVFCLLLTGCTKQQLLNGVNNSAPSTETTTDWKLYQNKDFSFKYPSTYHIIKDDGLNISIAEQQTDVHPLLYINLSNQSDWSQEKLCSQNGGLPGCLKQEITNTTIGGKEARDIYEESGQGLQHIVQIDNPSLEIFYFLGEQQPDSESDKEFKAILSSFTFFN
jgi:hypothetical protein